MPTYRIHPAIGFARVGNSPEFFIGPEKRYEYPDPPGGFKDALCRVKRQAARFRIFEYPDAPGGAPVELDVAASGATLTWKVELYSATEHAVPGISGTTDILRTSDSIFLGQLRTDATGKLIVLGGFGWMQVSGSLTGQDDTTDGSVRATLIIGDVEVPVAPAWIVVAGPKYAPQLDHLVTLWDIAENRIHGTAPVPAPVSYTEHIYPILKRAQSMRYVVQAAAGHHAWDLGNVGSLPREQIYEALRVPAGMTPLPDPTPATVAPRNMPDLAGGGVGLTLTRLQYLRMQEFYTGNFVVDWVSEPVPTAGPPSASELDRAALEACCGGAFTAGVESSNWIAYDLLYEPAERLRLKQPLGPGTLRSALDKPWAADYMAYCQRFWPIAAPAQVLRGLPGSEVYEEWCEGTSSTITPTQVLAWPELGFVVRNETTGKHVVQECRGFSVPPERLGRERFRFFWERFRRYITIADPPPIDIIRGIRRFVLEARAPAPEGRVAADELSRLLEQLEQLDAPTLRVRLVDLKAELARLETAVALVEERLKARRS